MFEVENLIVNETDLEAISRQVQEGYTAGRVDSESGRCVSWVLNTEVYKI